MNIFRASKIENIECENQARFVQERIISTEEHLSTLCSVFGTYIQKICRVRDASDDIATTIFKYGSEETVNKTLKCNLLKFAENIALIGDIRDNEISHLEHNVLKQFLQYNTLCRNAKNQVRNIYHTKEIELNRRRHLGKIRQKDPHNRKTIAKAEIELSKAVTESSQVQRALEEHIEIFEKKKINDIKTILMEFVMSELRFHKEAINLYSQAYRSVMDINVEDDFQIFQEILKKSPITSRIEIVKKMSEQSTKLSPSRAVVTNTENSPTIQEDSQEFSSQASLSDDDEEETNFESSYNNQKRI